MLRLETHPRHARGEQSFTCKCHNATYEGRVMLYANPHLQQRKHNVSFSTPFHDTASRKREPNVHPTRMPAHNAITPQFGDPHRGAPPPSYHVRPLDHLSRLALTCMTPSLSRDRLTAQHVSLHVLGLAVSQDWTCQPHVQPKATQAQAIRSCCRRRQRKLWKVRLSSWLHDDPYVCST
jgi:hypothetical protein